MPTTPEQIDLWRTADREVHKLEFKEARNHFDFDRLLEYSVAMANEGGGTILLGIANEFSRPVVGSKAYPNLEKTKVELESKLRFPVDVEAVDHPDGRVVVFHVPSRPPGELRHIGGAYFARPGQSVARMTPAQMEKIFKEGNFSFRKKLSARRTDAYKVITLIGLLLLLIVVATSYSQWHDAHATAKEWVKTVKRHALPSAAKPARDWHVKKNWQESIHVGLTREEVEKLFGEAEQINESQNFETWHYGFASITFYEGKVYSWLEPD